MLVPSRSSSVWLDVRCYCCFCYVYLTACLDFVLLALPACPLYKLFCLGRQSLLLLLCLHLFDNSCMNFLLGVLPVCPLYEFLSLACYSWLLLLCLHLLANACIVFLLLVLPDYPLYKFLCLACYSLPFVIIVASLWHCLHRFLASCSRLAPCINSSVWLVIRCLSLLFVAICCYCCMYLTMFASISCDLCCRFAPSVNSSVSLAHRCYCYHVCIYLTMFASISR